MKSYFVLLILYDRFFIVIKKTQYYHALPITLFFMKNLVHTYLVYLLHFWCFVSTSKTLRFYKGAFP